MKRTRKPITGVHNLCAEADRMLTACGFVLTRISSRGSRYYAIPDHEWTIRVSDHANKQRSRLFGVASRITFSPTAGSGHMRLSARAMRKMVALAIGEYLLAVHYETKQPKPQPETAAIAPV